MNAVERNGAAGTPVRLAPDDFEVFRTELQTQAATVVMLDMSRSMIYNGCFLPAKKVALALNALIRGQFPRDSLYIVGFSLYAREFTADQLPHLAPERVERRHQHARGLPPRAPAPGPAQGRQQADHHDHRRRADRAHGGRRARVRLPADAAHAPGDAQGSPALHARAASPSTPSCSSRATRSTAFVEQMTRINRGRAFFATSDRARRVRPRRLRPLPPPPDRPVARRPRAAADQHRSARTLHALSDSHGVVGGLAIAQTVERLRDAEYAFQRARVPSAEQRGQVELTGRAGRRPAVPRRLPPAGDAHPPPRSDPPSGGWPARPGRPRSTPPTPR